MNLFYIRHHYQSIVRSKSFGGEVYAFVLLLLFLGSAISIFYKDLDQLVILVQEFVPKESDANLLILLTYLFLDLGSKTYFRRPIPKTKYYVLIKDASASMARQYMVTSLVGIVPLMTFGLLMVFSAKAYAWAGIQVALSVFMFGIANHYIGLWSQFGTRLMFSIILSIYLIIGLFELLVPSFELISLFFHSFTAIVAVLLVMVGSYREVEKFISSKVIPEGGGAGFLDRWTKGLKFKNPLIQLEASLILRNKRTRTNFLSAFILIPIFLLNPTNYQAGEAFLVVAFMMTNLFSIQHGMYSFGWESSYFDFLLVNCSASDFFYTRWNLLMVLNMIGLILCMVACAIAGISVLGTICMFLYGCGVSIPFVLYRNQYHDSRIELSESAFANYNGVMTGPLIVSSLLSLIMPAILYYVFRSIIPEMAAIAFGLLGAVGLMLRPLILKHLSKSFQKRKYHLSQSFKA